MCCPRHQNHQIHQLHHDIIITSPSSSISPIDRDNWMDGLLVIGFVLRQSFYHHTTAPLPAPHLHNHSTMHWTMECCMSSPDLPPWHTHTCYALLFCIGGRAERLLHELPGRQSIKLPPHVSSADNNGGSPNRKDDGASSGIRKYFTDQTKAIVWGMQQRAVQSMLDFDFICRYIIYTLIITTPPHEI